MGKCVISLAISLLNFSQTCQTALSLLKLIDKKELRNVALMKEIALNSTLGILIRVKIQTMWCICEEIRDQFISSHFSFTFLGCLRNNTSKGVFLNMLLNIESADR